MSFFGFDPDGLFSAGTALGRLDPHAASIADRVLQGYSSAAAVVVHPVLRDAFKAFGDQHSALHHSLGPEVRKAGAKLADGTNALSDGQNESTATQQRSLAAAELTSAEGAPRY